MASATGFFFAGEAVLPNAVDLLQPAVTCLQVASQFFLDLVFPEGQTASNPIGVADAQAINSEGFADDGHGCPGIPLRLLPFRPPLSSAPLAHGERIAGEDRGAIGLLNPVAQHASSAGQ